MAFCAQCKCPLDMPEVHSIDGKNLVCAACNDLYWTVAGNPWFLRAEEEYQRELKKVKRLRLGADYFG